MPDPTQPVSGPIRPWTFDVELVGGSQPTDYGTGTEWDGEWQWAIYDGPDEQTDVVLLGMTDREDPTPVLAALVAEHNRLVPVAPEPQDVPTAFSYTNWRGETSIRHVIPKGIRYAATEWHTEPQWLLDAFDIDRGADRSFALSGIGARPVGDVVHRCRTYDSGRGEPEESLVAAVLVGVPTGTELEIRRAGGG